MTMSRLLNTSTGPVVCRLMRCEKSSQPHNLLMCHTKRTAADKGRHLRYSRCCHNNSPDVCPLLCCCSTSNAVTNSLYKCAPTYTTVPFKEGAGISYPEDDDSSGDKYDSASDAGDDSPATGYDSSAHEVDDDYGEDGAGGSSSSSDGPGSRGGGSSSSGGSKGGGDGGSMWDNEHDLQGSSGHAGNSGSSSLLDDEEGWETNVPPRSSSGGSGASGTKRKPGYEMYAGYEVPTRVEDAAKIASKVKAKARFQAKKRQMVPMVAGGHHQHHSARAGTPRAGVQLTTKPTTAATSTATTAEPTAATAGAQNPGVGDIGGVLNPASGGPPGRPYTPGAAKVGGGPGF